MNPPILPAGELAAVYRRVSTDQQDGSLALQEKRVNDYAVFYRTPGTQRPLELREGLTFSDPDVSGRVPMLDRPGGRALLNRLRLGDVKHLIVAKLDRIGRNTRDALGVLEFLKQQDIVLHITDFGGETISTQGHMGRLILTVLLAVAEWEAGEIRDRTTKIMRGKFDRHELTGNVPYGYDAEYTFPDGYVQLSPIALTAQALADLGHGEPVSKLLVDNLPEQAILRQLAAWRAEPAPLSALPSSYTRVAARANAHGYVTKQGFPWQCGSISNVLNSRHSKRLLQTPAPVGVQALA